MVPVQRSKKKTSLAFCDARSSGKSVGIHKSGFAHKDTIGYIRMMCTHNQHYYIYIGTSILYTHRASSSTYNMHFIQVVFVAMGFCTFLSSSQ